MTVKHLLCLAITTLFIVACQSTPEKRVNESTHTNAISISAQEIGENFIWGGEILEITNLKNTTELTVLSYPLDKNRQPRVDDISIGRFIAVYSGFLEPTDYRTGRLISITGNLIDIRAGKVANADYKFPVLSIDDLSLHRRKPRGLNLPFSIGIGIGIHN